MNIRLTAEMIDYYNLQLEYANTCAARAKSEYNEWNNASYAEDSADLAITYTARAGLAHDEYLFWLSVASSIKCKLIML